MPDINPEDHFGKDLPADQLLPHELRARQFIGIAQKQMSELFPDITFFAFNTSGIDIFKGGSASKQLSEWDSPAMDGLRDSGLKEYLQELVVAGDQADVESPDLARVECSMYGDKEEELTEAMKKILILAAEKGGSLEKEERGKNRFRSLKKRDPSLERLSKEFSFASHFIFT